MTSDDQNFLPFEYVSAFIAESLFLELDLYPTYAYATARGHLKKSTFLVIGVSLSCRIRFSFLVFNWCQRVIHRRMLGQGWLGRGAWTVWREPRGCGMDQLCRTQLNRTVLGGTLKYPPTHALAVTRPCTQRRMRLAGPVWRQTWQNR